MNRGCWHQGKVEENKLALVSTRLKKNFLVEEFGFSFPVHLSTEVWTHRKYIITSLPRAGESQQRLHLFWVRAEETVPGACPHTMIPQGKNTGMLAQLGKYIYPFALFQQDLTLTPWLKCSGHGSSEENGGLLLILAVHPLDPDFSVAKKCGHLVI